MLKECTECKKIKWFWDFYNDKNNKEFGLRAQCKKCLIKRNKKYKTKHKKRLKEYYKNYRKDNIDYIQKYQKEYYKNNRKTLLEKQKKASKERHYIINYGITLEERDKIIIKQNNKCKICKKSFDENKRRKYPCVDHNHKTKKIRGILCDNCNKMLGHAKDNIEILKLAIKYIEDN